MVRIHGVGRSSWVHLLMKSNLATIMNRQVMAMAQLFGGSLLQEDAEIPHHTHALVFNGASAALRFSMALQVVMMYGKWDNDVLANSVRPHFSRSGHLLLRGPTASLVVVTLTGMDAVDLMDMLCSMNAYNDQGRWIKGRRSGEFASLRGANSTSVIGTSLEGDVLPRQPYAVPPPGFSPPNRTRLLTGGSRDGGIADEAQSSSRSVGTNDEVDAFDDEAVGGFKFARRSFMNAITRLLPRGAGKRTKYEGADSRHDVLRRVWLPREVVRHTQFSEVGLPAFCKDFDTSLLCVYCSPSSSRILTQFRKEL